MGQWAMAKIDGVHKIVTFFDPCVFEIPTEFNEHGKKVVFNFLRSVFKEDQRNTWSVRQVLGDRTSTIGPDASLFSVVFCGLMHDLGF
mmetsp:Transcript_34705/g.48105  ORF Transcript_34705/g.48105 Transcript_34705/m.48105 type:complete len:88 (+) Transcript_34705:126-389(+)